MPASLYMPTITVELALTSGYTTPEASRVWTDVTDYVEAQEGIDIKRGRQNEQGSAQPATVDMTLDNRDGRFTPDNVAGAYYPNIKKGRPIRVRAALPGNMLTANIASIETSAAWDNQGATSVVQSAVRAVDGTKSLLITWPAVIAGVRVRTGAIGGITVGLTYTFSTSVWVPAGSPDVRLTGEGAFGAVSASTALKDQWVRLTLTDVAGAGIPNFTVSPMSGSGTVFVDAAMVELGGAASEFTLLPATTYDRIVAYVDDWPTEWPDGTASRALAPISATSRLARTAQGAEFRSLLTEEMEYDRPVLHYELSEPAGATQAGNIANGRGEALGIVASGAGGGIAFGSGVGPPTDGLSAVVLTPTSESVGSRLMAALLTPVTVVGDHALAISAWFVSNGTPTIRRTLAALTVGEFERAGNPAVWATSLSLNFSSDNRLNAEFASGSGTLFQKTSGAVFPANDNLLHHAVAILEIADAGTAKAKLVLDNVDLGYSASVTWPFMAGGVAYMPPFDHLSLGGQAFAAPGPGGNDCLTGTIGQVAVWRKAAAAFDLTRFADHYTAGLTGFTTEGSGARIGRYGRLAGIPVAEQTIDAGGSTAIANIDTTGKTPVAVMQVVELVEDGVVFDGKDGRLTFHARTRRWAATSAFTRDRNTGGVEEGLKPITDDAGMVNDLSASRAGGIKVRAVDQASIDEYGFYRPGALELATTSDSEVQSRADWEVKRRAVPRSRLSSVPVDILNASLPDKHAMLAADISTRFTLANLPPQAPAATLDLFIEGYTEHIGAEEYTMSFNTSSVAYSQVWLLDSAIASQLDSTTVLAY